MGAGQINQFKAYLILCQLLNFLWQLNSGYFQQGWWHITLATTITNWWHRARMSLLGLRAWSLAKKGNRLSLGWRGRIGTLWWCWGPLLGAGLWWGGSLRGCRPLCSSTGPLVLHWIRNRFWLLWNGLWSFCSFSTGSMDNLSRLFGDPSKDTLISRLTLPLHALQDTMTWSVHNSFYQNDLLVWKIYLILLLLVHHVWGKHLISPVCQKIMSPFGHCISFTVDHCCDWKLRFWLNSPK